MTHKSNFLYDNTGSVASNYFIFACCVPNNQNSATKPDVCIEAENQLDDNIVLSIAEPTPENNNAT